MPLVLCDPFLLSSRFSSLQTVKLREIGWYPSTPTQSPLLGLPSTLLHLEFEEAVNQMFRAPTGSLPLCHLLLTGVDFSVAFPQLESLSLAFNYQRLTVRQAESEAERNWISTVPSSLTSLKLVAVGNVVALVRFLLGEPVRQRHATTKLTADDSSSTAPSPSKHVHPFPLLRSLEIEGMNLTDYSPLANYLPPLLTHICCSRHRSYFGRFYCSQSTFEATSDSILSDPARNLRTIHLDGHSSDETLKGFAQRTEPVSLFLNDLKPHFIIPLPISSRLKRLELLARVTGHSINADAQPKLPLEQLIASGTQLDYLSVWSIAPPEMDEEQEKLISTVLASLSTLDVRVIQREHLTLLPATLKTLSILQMRFRDRNVNEWFSLLPTGLLSLTCPHLCCEIGHVPLLPRSITDLSFSPCNRQQLGTQFVSAEELASGLLPYDEIDGDMAVLPSLPPNLVTLQMSGESLQLDSKFGLFLPRSVRTVVGHKFFSLNIADRSRSKLGRIGGFFGIGGIPGTKELLKRAINFFPPSCQIHLVFYAPGVLNKERVRVSDEEVAKVCRFSSLMY